MEETPAELHDNPFYQGRCEQAHGEILEHILFELENIGDSSEKIAAHLEGAGIKGFQVDASCCPIAVYLRRQMKADLVTVSRMTGTVYFQEIAYMFDMPREITAFISAFDSSGQPFPNLIKDRRDGRHVHPT